MTADEHNQLSGVIADRMNLYVREFVTPLSEESKTNVRLIGTGSFVKVGAKSSIITCEHVVRDRSLNFKFCDSEDVFGYRGDWQQHCQPVDVAISEEGLSSCPPTLQCISPNQIADCHTIMHDTELLYFYGFSGENSKLVMETLITYGVGYLTQQNRDMPDNETDFEILWPSGSEKLSPGTSDEARKLIRFSNPEGFSGSLIWNTRFMETGCNIDTWSPSDARVTGILKRFDQNNSVLIATRIEKVRGVISF